MKNKSIEFMKCSPPVYQESSRPFWDDEHISKSMLAAHLDKGNDGASRKLSTIQKSVEWIFGYCENAEGKHLLDLGCGVGIYAELLHDKGFSVTGIDFSQRSIDYAQNHAVETKRNIEYHYQNYLEMNFDNEFDVAILVYCDFGVLSPEDRNILLRKIHKALKKDGILILDVFNVPYAKAFQELKSIKYEDAGFWSANPYVVIQKNELYRKTNNTLEQYLVITEDGCECFNIWNQIYSIETFMEEIERGGFETKDIFDDICGKKYTGAGENMCGIFWRR